MKSIIPGLSLKRISPIELEQGEDIKTTLGNSIIITTKSLVKVTDRYTIDHYVASPVTIAGIRMQKVRLIDKNKKDTTTPLGMGNDNISFEIIDLDKLSILNLKVSDTDKTIVNIYSNKEKLGGKELFKAQLEDSDNVFMDDYGNITKIVLNDGSEINRIVDHINIGEKSYIGVITSESKSQIYVDSDSLEIFEIDGDIVVDIIPLSKETNCNYKVVTRAGIIYETEKTTI